MAKPSKKSRRNKASPSAVELAPASPRAARRPGGDCKSWSG